MVPKTVALGHGGARRVNIRFKTGPTNWRGRGVGLWLAGFALLMQMLVPLGQGVFTDSADGGPSHPVVACKVHGPGQPADGERRGDPGRDSSNCAVCVSYALGRMTQAALSLEVSPPRLAWDLAHDPASEEEARTQAAPAPFHPRAPPLPVQVS